MNETSACAAIDPAISPQEALIQFAPKRCNLRLEALDIMTDIRERESARTEIRDEIKLAVANEVNEDGKPAYSNEDKRMAERGRREAENAELRKVNETIDRLYRRLSVTQIDADYYADMIRIGCAFAGQDN